MLAGGLASSVSSERQLRYRDLVDSGAPPPCEARPGLKCRGSLDEARYPGIQLLNDAEAK